VNGILKQKIQRRFVEKKVTYVGKTKNINFWPKEEVEKYTDIK
jgi:DNA-binding transcriptional regulator/RsmH inhibitor MraZ